MADEADAGMKPLPQVWHQRMRGVLVDLLAKPDVPAGVWPPSCRNSSSRTPGIHPTRIHKHYKRVAWFSFSMHAYCFAFKVMMLRLPTLRGTRALLSVAMVGELISFSDLTLCPRQNLEVFTRESVSQFCLGGSNSRAMNCVWIAFTEDTCSVCHIHAKGHLINHILELSQVLFELSNVDTESS